VIYASPRILDRFFGVQHFILTTTTTRIQEPDRRSR
jgi:hypothetical protein